MLRIESYQPAAGDLIGFSAAWNDPIGWLIKVGTLSSVSHVAGVARITRDEVQAENDRRWGENLRDPRGRAPNLSYDFLGVAADAEVLIESTTLCREPCLLQKRGVSGVQAHWPAERIQAYLAAGGRAWLYRPSVDWQLFQREKDLLSEFLLRHVGDHYDYRSAALSAERLFKNRWWYHPANTHALFCSELWSAALQRIGRLGATDASVINPAVLLRTIVKIGRYECLGEFQA